MIWIEKYQQEDSSKEILNAEKVREYGAKIAILQRKIGQLAMEFDHLWPISTVSFLVF
jgi:hypothetical protein